MLFSPLVKKIIEALREFMMSVTGQDVEQSPDVSRSLS